MLPAESHHTLDHIGRELLHQVHRVVYIQFFDDSGQFRVGHGIDNTLLIRHIEIGKNICGCLF